LLSFKKDETKKAPSLPVVTEHKTLEAVENIENLITFGRLRAQSVGDLADPNQ
jgi:hypothetical protein